MTVEDRLQISCVRWFDLQYHALSNMLHHSPNGGFRNIIEATKFKRMGTRAGFPDLILLVQRHGYGCLCIELKDGKKGRQSKAQHEWELNALTFGNKYVICRSFDEFQQEINSYLTDKNHDNPRI